MISAEIMRIAEATDTRLVQVKKYIAGARELLDKLGETINPGTPQDAAVTKRIQNLSGFTIEGTFGANGRGNRIKIHFAYKPPELVFEACWEDENDPEVLKFFDVFSWNQFGSLLYEKKDLIATGVRLHELRARAARLKVS
ncbi:MAG TPA: hypothetical protein VFT82_04100 [Candidatus Paceibacterota bacterium]|nr:hypothetical protein [Candidatus Paceibacterota bacterium]